MPARGFFGQLEEKVLPHVHKVFLFTHHHFHIEYNGPHVVLVNVSEISKEVLLPEPVDDSVTLDVQFTYSVQWVQNNKYAACCAQSGQLPERLVRSKRREML
jgi:transmembrane 9 superfamily member 1